VGNAIDWYDFAVFGAAAALVGEVLTSGGSTSMTMVFAVFGLAFLARPVGALLGAAWADRSGRRPPLVTSVVVMTVSTAGIGLLPPWTVAGSVVVVALVALRLVQGLATGMEVVVSIAYLVEHAPQGRRGLWGGAQMSTMAAGFAGGTAAVWCVTATLPPGAVTSWGWRVPFLLALPLGVAALWLRRRAVETPEFRAWRTVEPEPTRGRWAELRPHRGTVVQGFVLTSVLMSSFTLWFVHLPARLHESGVQRLPVALGGVVLGLLALSLSAVLCGHASDRWGRRPVLVTGLGVVALSWILGYPAALDGSATELVAGFVAVGVGLGGLVLQSTITDALPVPVRTTGLAVSVGVAAAVVGGTSPLVAQTLAGVAGWLVGGYALAWVAAGAAAAGPLTRSARLAAAPAAPLLGSGPAPGRAALTRRPG
jgi:MHS family proline/betaine transporter-like MFS transporter